MAFPVLNAHRSASWSGSFAVPTPAISADPRKTGQSPRAPGNETTNAPTAVPMRLAGFMVATSLGSPRRPVDAFDLRLRHRPGVEPGRPLLARLVRQQREDTLAHPELFQRPRQAGGTGQV